MVRTNDLSLTGFRMVYVRGLEYEREIQTYVSKVRFFLHPSFAPNDIVEVRDFMSSCNNGRSTRHLSKSRGRDGGSFLSEFKYTSSIQQISQSILSTILNYTKTNQVKEH